MSGIYLHIPFCKQVCSYCDFYFVTQISEQEHFVQKLLEEIESYRGSRFTRETVETIYFGGGTPSLLEIQQVEKILETIRDVFELQPQEITLEANPDDTSEEFLSALHSVGINRISIGVQTFDSDLLNLLNRAHSKKEALQSLKLLDNSAFESFNADLLYGNPNQSVEQLSDDVDQLLQFNPPHVSAYMLTIEPETPLGEQVKPDLITPLKNDKVIDQFELINDRFQEQGIKRYEISNYSRPGYEAIHNSSHWYHKNYLGMGPSAHSFWWDEKALRWENEPSLEKYFHGKHSSNKEQLTHEELAEERLMMGLRTRNGVGINELSDKYNYRLSDRQKEYMRKRAEEDKIELTNHIRLTDKGIKIADALILDLVTLH